MISIRQHSHPFSTEIFVLFVTCKSLKCEVLLHEWSTPVINEARRDRLSLFAAVNLKSDQTPDTFWRIGPPTAGSNKKNERIERLKYGFYTRWHLFYCHKTCCKLEVAMETIFFTFVLCCLSSSSLNGSFPYSLCIPRIPKWLQFFLFSPPRRCGASMNVSREPQLNSTPALQRVF